MGAHPRVLLRTVTAALPPGSQLIMTWEAGTEVDAAPGSELEAAIGAQNLGIPPPGYETHPGTAN